MILSSRKHAPNAAKLGTTNLNASNTRGTYSPKKCTVCDKLIHFAGNCKELEKFPPKERELNCLEAGKNY
jgi:hypothetical protein